MQKSFNFVRNCTFCGKKQLNDTQIAKSKKRETPNISLNIQYLYESPVNPPSSNWWNPLYIYLPFEADDWKWNIRCILLKGDFPSEYSAIIGSGRDICDQIEMVKKAAKLEEVLNKVSEEIKKLLNEIGHLKRINILQESYFFIWSFEVIKPIQDGRRGCGGKGGGEGWQKSPLPVFSL